MSASKTSITKKKARNSWDSPARCSRLKSKKWRPFISSYRPSITRSISNYKCQNCASSRMDKAKSYSRPKARPLWLCTWLQKWKNTFQISSLTQRRPETRSPNLPTPALILSTSILWFQVLSTVWPTTTSRTNRPISLSIQIKGKMKITRFTKAT